MTEQNSNHLLLSLLGHLNEQVNNYRLAQSNNQNKKHQDSTGTKSQVVRNSFQQEDKVDRVQNDLELEEDMCNCYNILRSEEEKEISKSPSKTVQESLATIRNDSHASVIEVEVIKPWIFPTKFHPYFHPLFKS